MSYEIAGDLLCVAIGYLIGRWRGWRLAERAFEARFHRASMRWQEYERQSLHLPAPVPPAGEQHEHQHDPGGGEQQHTL